MYYCSLLTVLDHINHLLYKHNCVIVPGLGGFLTQEKPASFNEQNGSIQPKHKSLAFNAQLTENDGLLAHHLQHKEGISYDQAIKTIASFVNELQTKLNENQNADLEALGTLYQKNGLLVFVARPTVNYDLSTYGLQSFKVRPVRQVQDSKKQGYKVQSSKRQNSKSQSSKKQERHFEAKGSGKINLNIINVLGSIFILAMVFSLLNVEFSQKGELSYTAQYLDSAFEDLKPSQEKNGFLPSIFNANPTKPAYSILLNGTFSKTQVENIQRELSQKFAQSEIIEMENNEYTISVISFMNKDLAKKYRDLVQKNISYQLTITEK